MNDALRAEFTGMPEKSGTRVLPPALSHMPCQVCHGRATVDDNWQPGPGYDPDFYRYTCVLGHHSYRAVRRRVNR